MSDRLSMLRRVSQLRERRAERERIAARAEVRRCEEEAMQAERVHAREQVRKDEADARFADHAADPQAQVWRTISHRRAARSHDARMLADEVSAEASDAANAARSRHERSLERNRQLGFMLVGERAAVRRRREVLAEEASEETRR